MYVSVISGVLSFACNQSYIETRTTSRKFAYGEFDLNQSVMLETKLIYN